MKKQINQLILSLWQVAFAAIILLGVSTLVLAQRTINNPPDPTAACGMMGCGLVVWLLVMLLIVVGAIALTVFIIRWIGRDATTRGMPNANSIKWLGLLGLLGLLIYVLKRPQGNVMPCPHCGKPRMQGTPQCPHCAQP